MSKKFCGKYRGVVLNNLDPEQRGRIQAQVPDVLGVVPTAWAMPSVPCNLPKKAGSALPKIGAGVWIEFEQGDPNNPIWSGCFFVNATETPPALRNAT
ncbi:MAG: phage baseplate assembly protein V [Verrucomicrobiota bacterium]